MTYDACPKLHDYIAQIRPIIPNGDLFGQQLIKLSPRQTRSALAGLFAQVRAVVDAVSAAGGTLDNAKEWATQVFNWHRKRTPISYAFARFELDPHAARAMENLLALIA